MDAPGYVKPAHQYGLSFGGSVEPAQDEGDELLDTVVPEASAGA